jgi:hypothetical protein
MVQSAQTPPASPFDLAFLIAGGILVLEFDKVGEVEYTTSVVIALTSMLSC